jgi:hypothetical protein
MGRLIPVATPFRRAFSAARPIRLWHVACDILAGTLSALAGLFPGRFSLKQKRPFPLELEI